LGATSGALQTLTKLYFPELENEATELVRLHYEDKMLSISLLRDLLVDKRKPTLEQPRSEIVETFQEASRVKAQQLTNARQTLRTAARNLLIGILNVK
jgi:hypothetical protein